MPSIAPVHSHGNEHNSIVWLKKIVWLAKVTFALFHIHRHTHTHTKLMYTKMGKQCVPNDNTYPFSIFIDMKHVSRVNLTTPQTHHFSGQRMALSIKSVLNVRSQSHWLQQLHSPIRFVQCLNTSWFWAALITASQAFRHKHFNRAEAYKSHTVAGTRKY